MSLESEKCHHPGYPLLVGQSRILSVTSQGSDAQEDEKNRSRRRGGCQGIRQLTERAPRELVGKGIGHREGVISTAAVPAKPMNLSTCTRLSK